jgi:hypothetical protein
MSGIQHVEFRRAQPPDYPAILELQHANLLKNVQGDSADGFLSVEYTGSELDAMNRDLGVFVAVKDGVVVGYLCGTSCGYAARYPILAAMIDRFPLLSMEGEGLSPANTFIYGPVCIARHERGSGILSGLYEALKEAARSSYTFCALFISDRNRRSLDAHRRKLGMSMLGAFEALGAQFHILGARI